MATSSANMPTQSMVVSRYCPQGQALETACRSSVDKAGETAERFEHLDPDPQAEQLIELAETQAMAAMEEFVAHCQSCDICVHPHTQN